MGGRVESEIENYPNTERYGKAEIRIWALGLQWTWKVSDFGKLLTVDIIGQVFLRKRLAPFF